MILIKVLISPKGVHHADLIADMDEDEEARKFYKYVKPLLKEIDRKILKELLPQ